MSVPVPPVDLTQTDDPNRQNQVSQAGSTLLEAGANLADGVVAVVEMAGTAVVEVAGSAASVGVQAVGEVAAVGAEAAGAVAGGLVEALGAILGGLG